jgi:sarcosine oxidase subunit alpha
MRIQSHPILTFPQEKKISFSLDGKTITGFEKDSIASAIHAEGITTLSYSLRHNHPRGFFCGIGKCSSCLMQVNGIPNVRTCITPVQEGMIVQSQKKIGSPPTAPYKKTPKKKIKTHIVIIGAGPAGISAGLTAAKQGVKVLLVDENPHLGGQLIKQTHRFFGSKEEQAGTRGIHIAKEFSAQITHTKKIDLLPNTTVIGYYKQKKGHILIALKRIKTGEELTQIHCDKIIFACGARENMVSFPGNDLPGVYGAGGVQTLMNVYGIKPGNTVLMVGAGNVGLIVSYQLLQAGVQVTRVVEALPTIGGYHVHAAKLRRCNIPIYTSTSIKEALGTEKVTGATTIKLDENLSPIKKTEETISCDTICLAVGLTPSTELLMQTGAQMTYLSLAGGYIAAHNQEMETTQKGVYVAGDLANIEEASTAMLEGKIAGLSAARSLGYRNTDDQKLEGYLKRLENLRSGSFGKLPREAKRQIHKKMGGK